MCFFVFLLFFFFNDTATTEIYTLSLHDALPISAHGGVEEWPRAVFEAGAGFLFLAWSIWIFFNREEQLVLSRLLPPLAALAFIVLGQWFFRWTACPYNTRIELLLLLADLIVRFLAVQAF